MIDRLSSETCPNFLFLRYDQGSRAARELFVIPKRFMTADVIERRAPLGPMARRAGWVGCNIMLAAIPRAGRVFMINDGNVVPPESVIQLWKKTAFLESLGDQAKGWLLDTMIFCDRIQKKEFTLDEIYAFEFELALKYPANRFIREKLRQQLQVLRDEEYLDFLGGGRYRLK